MAKRDNGSPRLKQQVRREVRERFTLPPSVLELFAGEGRLRRSSWAGCHGATMDMDPAKATQAATDSPTWATYEGDSERALLTGWMGHHPWDVIDVDAYGSPWPFVRARFLSERERAPVTWLILTDGRLARLGISGLCWSLTLPGENRKAMGKPEIYMERAHTMAAEWAKTAGMRVASFVTKKTPEPPKGPGRVWMRAHVLEVRR